MQWGFSNVPGVFKKLQGLSREFHGHFIGFYGHSIAFERILKASQRCSRRFQGRFRGLDVCSRSFWDPLGVPEDFKEFQERSKGLRGRSIRSNEVLEAFWRYCKGPQGCSRGFLIVSGGFRGVPCMQFYGFSRVFQRVSGGFRSIPRCSNALQGVSGMF